MPRHRLIRNLIKMDAFEKAETEIRIFEKDFGVARTRLPVQSQFNGSKSREGPWHPRGRQGCYLGNKHGTLRRLVLNGFPTTTT